MTTIIATPALVSIYSAGMKHPGEGVRLNRVHTPNGYYCPSEPVIRIFATYQAVHVPGVGIYEA